MPRKKLTKRKRELTKSKAREMASLRENNRGGRPKIPTPCPKCATVCDSYRKAQAHC